MELAGAFKLILYSSLMGSVVAGIILMIKVIFKNRLSAGWHYYIWFLIVIRLIIPYTVSSPLSVFNLVKPAVHGLDKVRSQSSANSIKVGRNLSPGSNYTIAGVKTPSKPVQTPVIPFGYRMAGIVWVMGILVGATIIIMTYLRFALRVKRQPTETDSTILGILEESKLRMGVRSNIAIVNNAGVKTPAVFGIFQPKLSLPKETIDRLSEDEKRYVILHELAHLKRGDIFVNWLITALQVVYWFNPIIWFAIKRMRQDCEIACDAMVLSRIKPEERRSYGHTIIRLLEVFAEPHWIPGTSSFVGKFHVKRRIRMISLFNKRSLKWSIVGIVLAVVIGVVGLTNDKGFIGLKKPGGPGGQPKNSADSKIAPDSKQIDQDKVAENKALAIQGPQLIPVDEAQKNQSFLEFRGQLQTAVKEKNVEFLKRHLDPKIRFTFGDGGGTKDFFRQWGLDKNPATSGLWDVLGQVIELGGSFDARNNFWAPYVYSNFPEKFDAFEYAAVTGPAVQMYAKPDAKSEVTGLLNYNVVKLLPSTKNQDTDGAKQSWQKIQAVEGVEGYIEKKFVRSPIDYRACFTQKDGTWTMTLLVAGD